MYQTVVLYDAYPFDECYDPSVCEEPIGSCSGTACPISCVTECLLDGEYYVVVTLIDEVGNETVYYAGLDITTTCGIMLMEGTYIGPPECIEWDPVTGDTIGE